MESVRYFKVQGVIMCLAQGEDYLFQIGGRSISTRLEIRPGKASWWWNLVNFCFRGKVWKAGWHVPFLCFVFLDAAKSFCVFFFSGWSWIGGVQTWSVEDVCSRYFDGLGSRQESKPMVLRGFQVFWGSSKSPFFWSPLFLEVWSHLYEI